MINTSRFTCVILMLLLVVSTAVVASPSLLVVHFLDVGQADCILIQSPGGQNLLIDAGNNEDAPLITGYLNTFGIKRIDAVIGTHPHEDHIGSLDTVIDTYKIGSIYLPKVATHTKTFEDLLISIKNKRLKVSTAKAGVNINLDPALKVTMLAPNNAHYKELNSYSAVLKITYNRTSFLFTGDAETDSESEMLQAGYALKADVLKVGHHGSDSSTSKAFLTAVAPKYAVISVGAGNTYGHPHSITLKRLTKVAGVYRTDRDGTLVMTSDGKKVRVVKKGSSLVK